MNLSPQKTLCFHSFLLLTLAFFPDLDAREDLIASLEDVIGKPPEKSEKLKNKPRETFYSVVRSEENPEIKQLIDKQQMGLSLTEEEQELLKEYRMGANVSGSNSVIRRIYPPVLNWIENRVKVASGHRYSFIRCTANADGHFATALVLDPEIAQQMEAGKHDYNRIVRRMPVEAELPWEEPYRGRYVTHSPLGNILMAHAISVIIPINESLENAQDISIEDWKSVMDFYLKKKEVNPNSLFLVATKEFAGLALRLAAAYPFTGLILEEPEQGLFGQKFPNDINDAVAMTALQKLYEAELESLTGKTFIFRHRLNSALLMNDHLLLKPLLDRQKPLFLSMTDFPYRSISREDLENEVPNPRFIYDTESVEKISKRILYFIQNEGNTTLRILPEESAQPRSNNPTSALLKEMDTLMNQRINELMNEINGGGGAQQDGSGDGGEEL